MLSNWLTIFISPQKVLLAPSGPLRGVSGMLLVFRFVLVTDIVLQLDHVSGTTYLPVCETRMSAAQNSEDNWKHSCFRRTAAHRGFLIIAPYKYSYFLTYLLWPVVDAPTDKSVLADTVNMHLCEVTQHIPVLVSWWRKVEWLER